MNRRASLKLVLKTQKLYQHNCVFVILILCDSSTAEGHLTKLVKLMGAINDSSLRK